MLELNKIYNEDCLGNCKLGTGMWRLEDKSIDAIITDLPYGTTSAKWDTVIPFKPLWEQFERVIKDDGAIVLFGSQPFSSSLVMSNPQLFRYEWIWEKEKAANIFLRKNQPMKYHENILVFSKSPAHNSAKTPMKYYPQMEKRKQENKRNNKSRTNDKSEIYGEGRKYFNEREDKDNTDYIYPKSVQKFTSVRRNAINPTQKPVDLIEYLIKTYTNEGDIVLDSCMGSGTTAIACINTQRNYIGFEKEQEYHRLSIERIHNLT